MTEEEIDDGFILTDEPRSSKLILSAIRKAQDAFREWQTTCEVIDDIYSLSGDAYDTLVSGANWQDSQLDLFWASFEILKPAVYARPPQPVVAPLFKDGKALTNTTAELLERCAVSVFKRTGINDVMIQTRDDLLFAGRGAMWLRHEVEDGEHRVCVEHKDRLDFLHEPARKWIEVGWVSAGEWLTKADMRKRFRKHSGDAYKDAKYTLSKDDERRDVENRSTTRKCKVWEVWHKADNKVYWVTEGVDVLLDSGEPHLELSGFFPCPKPAFATLKRRSLIPVPDWERYAIHFSKISELTRRIYSLLDKVRMKGLIPAGGDVGDAVEQLISDDRDDQLLIPVPQAAMLMDGAGNFVQWLPLADIATAIQGLIDARATLIQNFYELSGISDIMRGATEADETLGAQQLKSQFGSVRVREKSAELQRVGADSVEIASEIIAQKFPQKQMLEMSQMEIPTKADIEKRIKGIEEAAKAELTELSEQAKKAMEQGGQQEQDPQQAEAGFKHAQQQILSKYAPMLQQAEQQVPIEDVVKLLRDDRARNFIFEIESSSTILTDELQEKQSRNEFMGEFATASQALMGLSSMGEAGAKLSGAMLKFVLAPYRAGRDLDGAIEEFIDAAPQMAAAAAGQGGEGEELIAAQKQLADAEMEKAKAAMAGVQAKAALNQAEMQRKMAEMQQKAQSDAFRAQAETEKLRQSLAASEAKTALIEAQINKLTADTAKVLASIGLDNRKQELTEYQAAEQSQARQVDTAMSIADSQRDAEFRERGEARADRGDERADRQQQFAEQQGSEP